MLADAYAAHCALWPAIRSVAEAHLEWAPPVVIEGWALLPEFVTPTLDSRAAAVWLSASRSILSGRIKKDGFLSSSERALQGFLDRSAEFDQRMRRSVPRHLLVEVLPQATVELLAEQCWKVTSSADEA